MPKDKKSFFEKLTGALEDEEKKDKIEVKSSKESAPKEWPQDQLPEEGQLTIDVYQTPTHVIIKSTIAGVTPEELDIDINNDMVTIRGERKQEEEIKKEDYYYQELYWGSFSRSVILPVEVEAQKADAEYKNGILTIKIPKVIKERTKKIKVKVI